MGHTEFGIASACFFSVLSVLDHIIWSYVGLLLIVVAGFYFSFKSRFLQFRILISAWSHIKSLRQQAKSGHEGVSPLKLYFASIGGMIGLGNLVIVAGTVTIGGPGSVLWMWLASFLGMMLKYSEIYLGVKHRIKTLKGYEGGPMYYLQAAFNSQIMKRLAPQIFCLLFCVYGVEIGQFTIITNSIASSYQVNRHVVIILLLVLVLFSSAGGVKRLANVCATLLSPFLLSYIAVGAWIILQHLQELPNLLALIVESAFHGHAAVAGFAGSTILQAAHYGVSRAVYSGDIGIGYDATVQSETNIQAPEQQAKIAILALFSDTLICTWTVLIILLTGTWKVPGLQLSDYLMVSLQSYLPMTNIYLTLMYFIAGFTTITGYLVMGKKCAQFLAPRFGIKIYNVYACLAFYAFSFSDQSQVLLVMSVSGGMLMLLNLCGVMRLRKGINFL